MIDIKTTIHDNFSIEFKIGFSGRRSIRDNNFTMNSWIFVPNSLDINNSTYGKDQFYRDVKSNVRLITPVFLLRDITGNDAIPFNNLSTAFNNLASDPSRTNITEYEFQIKMFAAIFKSSLRNEADFIKNNKDKKDIIYLCNSYVDNVSNILRKYRSLRQIINVPIVSEEVKGNFNFGDEYMSHIVDIHSIKIINKLDELKDDDYSVIRSKIVHMLLSEKDYKMASGYSQVKQDDDLNNRELVLRHGLLKKYVESALYLIVNKTTDGAGAEQIFYGITAGIAMLLATLMALPFQKTLGNYPALLFIILIISYMFKDRIKDIMRFYFVHKLKSKYYDHKTLVKIKEHEIGWIKEGMDFISNEKTPREILTLRNRSSLLEADNKLYEEKIILYRKKVYIDNEALSGHYEYRVSGINDIIRLHINRFTQKMDNPDSPLNTVDDIGDIVTINSQKIYNINIVLQFQYEDQLEYRGFRIATTRDGIVGIQQLTMNN